MTKTIFLLFLFGTESTANAEPPTPPAMIEKEKQEEENDKAEQELDITTVNQVF